MEIVKEYWWVFAGAVLLLFVMSRSKGGGSTVTQIGGQNETALAQLDATSAASDQQQRFGLISTFLGYDFQNRQLTENSILAKLGMTSTERIAKINADAATAAAASSGSIALALERLRIEQQNNAFQQQGNLQSQSNWMNLLGTGLQSVIPLLGGIFGGNGGGGYGGGNGGYGGTPPFFPGQSGNFNWWDWEFLEGVQPPQFYWL